MTNRERLILGIAAFSAGLGRLSRHELISRSICGGNLDSGFTCESQEYCWYTEGYSSISSRFSLRTFTYGSPTIHNVLSTF